jgi:phage-related protein
MLKPLVWMGTSRRDLRALPGDVVDMFGYALYLAQAGGRHPSAKVLRGFGDAAVLELSKNDAHGTYRAIYTVRFPVAVFVLHVFQKKSIVGIRTPRPDLSLIQTRLSGAALVAKEMTK